MIARLSGYETRWERQAALGIEGKYHGWDYPTSVSIVNQLDRVRASGGYYGAAGRLLKIHEKGPDSYPNFTSALLVTGITFEQAP